MVDRVAGREVVVTGNNGVDLLEIQVTLVGVDAHTEVLFCFVLLYC